MKNNWIILLVYLKVVVNDMLNKELNNRIVVIIEKILI